MRILMTVLTFGRSSVENARPALDRENVAVPALDLEVTTGERHSRHGVHGRRQCVGHKPLPVVTRDAFFRRVGASFELPLVRILMAAATFVGVASRKTDVKARAVRPVTCHTGRNIVGTRQGKARRLVVRRRHRDPLIQETEMLRLEERYTRTDYGHLAVRLTIDDSSVFAEPWIKNMIWNLAPQEELLEWVCENNKWQESEFE